MDTVVIDVFLLFFHLSLSGVLILCHLCHSYFVRPLHYPVLFPSLSLSISQQKAVRGFFFFFQEPVSCKIAQIAAALRLAWRTWEGKTKRKRKEGRFSAPTLLNCSYLHQSSNHTHTHERTQLQHAMPALVLPSLSLSMLNGQATPPTHTLTHTLVPMPQHLPHFALQFRPLH